MRKLPPRENFHVYSIVNKSCQKTTTLARRQPSLNSSQSFSQIGQTSRSRSWRPKLWYHVKGLVIRNTHVQYESSISSGWKLWPTLKFFKNRSNFKVTRPKIMVPSARSCHKECTCTIWKPYQFCFESYGQDYSFSKVNQTSSSRSQGKTFWSHAKGLVTRKHMCNMKNPTSSGLKVMAELEVFP